MKRYLPLTIMVGMMTLLFSAKTHDWKPAPKPRHTAKEAETLINTRLPELDFSIPMHARSKIKRRILREVLHGRKEMESMLGRSELYFPIIEHYLDKYNLPDHLKYVPFVESRFKIHAKSPAQAAGLWQFMPSTAKLYKLRITHNVDERYDCIKSSDAAARLFKDLHDEFGDWLLALAAYNCGSGRVKRAIRKAKSKDFWKIARFLPKETQHYIPSFITNVYLGNYYEQHILQPKPFTYDFETVKIIKVKDSVRLDKIAKMCGTTMKKLRMLNPSYLNDIVPASQKGHYLVLPANNWEEVRTYLEKSGKKPTETVFIGAPIPVA